MPCSACGSATCSIVAPSSSASFERRLEARADAGLDALAGQLLGHAERDPVEALGGRQRDRLRMVERRRVARVAAVMWGTAAPRR